MASQITIPVEGTTLTLNGYAFNSFADGDTIALTFPNEKTGHTLGTNQTTVIKDKLNGDVGEMALNIIKYGNDDIFLNPYAENGASAGLLNGTLQRNFTRDGEDFVESYDLSGGTITTKPDNTINTQDGEEVLVYNIRFAFAKRVI